MAIIIMNVLIGIIQELKAKKMVDDLSILVTPKAMVLRDGRVQEIIADEIVLDDIMVLNKDSRYLVMPVWLREVWKSMKVF